MFVFFLALLNNYGRDKAFHYSFHFGTFGSATRLVALLGGWQDRAVPLSMGSGVRQVWVQGLALPHFIWVTLRILLLAFWFPCLWNVNNTDLFRLFGEFNEILITCEAFSRVPNTWYIFNMCITDVFIIISVCYYYPIKFPFSEIFQYQEAIENPRDYNCPCWGVAAGTCWVSLRPELRAGGKLGYLEGNIADFGVKVERGASMTMDSEAVSWAWRGLSSRLIHCICFFQVWSKRTYF